jgi:hypothetical protein
LGFIVAAFNSKLNSQLDDGMRDFFQYVELDFNAEISLNLELINRLMSMNEKFSQTKPMEVANAFN